VPESTPKDRNFQRKIEGNTIMEYSPISEEHFMELVGVDSFPLVVKVKRDFPDLSLKDVSASINEAMRSSGIPELIQPGEQIAVTAGSRGIDRIGDVIRVIGEVIREQGAEPFVVPAMGSHGGATADGQKAMVEELGAAEEVTGVPIRSSMKTVEIGSIPSGAKVFIDRTAFESNGIIAVNRVKPHTSLIGKYGSGLCKMLVVGLGKSEGAAAFHRLGPLELERLLPEMARMVMEKAPVIGGVSLVEDARDKLAIVKAVTSNDIPHLDAELLEEAGRMMPRLPFDELDVLVVEEMGKNISGTGMDANVIGRRGIRLVPDPPSPRIRRIAVLGLSEKAHGNAHGIGMADVVTQRIAQAIDWEATHANALASSFPEKGMLPLTFPTDRDAVSAALTTSWAPDTRRARMVVIKNTLALEKMLVSESLIEEAKKMEDIEQKGELGPLPFSADGQLAVEW